MYFKFKPGGNKSWRSVTCVDLDRRYTRCILKQISSLSRTLNSNHEGNHDEGSDWHQRGCLRYSWGSHCSLRAVRSFAHLLNSNRSFSKMRMGPVELRMMRGWPLKRQKTEPARAVPRKLSITPCETQWGQRRETLSTSSWENCCGVHEASKSSFTCSIETTAILQYGGIHNDLWLHS